MELRNGYDIQILYAGLRDCCETLKYYNSLVALPYGNLMHKDQKRKGGDPYYIHPLTMAHGAFNLDLQSDEMIAAILLHDVLEDCNQKREELPVDENIREIVSLLTFVRNPDQTKEQDLFQYYSKIKYNFFATFAKFLDRRHNLSTMRGAFSFEKMGNYLIETMQFIYPLLEEAESRYPKYQIQSSILRNDIYHLVHDTEIILPEDIKRRVKQQVA